MSANQPVSWKEADPSELRKIKGVCLDIDDTLSTEGKLESLAYDSLWKLKAAGFAVVPVTGRPAGWCDHFARFWPVDAVVGENGAFTFFMKNGSRQRLTTPGALELNDAKVRLGQLGEAIKKEFPQAKWASDQAYREYDLAIDFCEDVTPWESGEIDRLVQFCKEQGAIAKVSSIHVNAWFGDYDKKKGIKNWLSEGAPGLSSGAVPSWNEWVFIGDSPNDEPMFESFDHSVGVANISNFLDSIQNPPKWITPSKSGDGFVEFAQKLVSSKQG